MLPAKPVLRTADPTSQDFSNNFTIILNSSMLCLICSSVHSVHCTLYSYRTNVHKLGSASSASSAKQLNNCSDHIIGVTHPLTDIGNGDMAYIYKVYIGHVKRYLSQLWFAVSTTESKKLSTILRFIVILFHCRAIL